MNWWIVGVSVWSVVIVVACGLCSATKSPRPLSSPPQHVRVLPRDDVA